MKSMKNNPKLLKMAELKLLEHELEGAWASLDYDKCNDLVERILKLQPKNTSALLLMGKIHGVQYNYEAAVDCFDEAIARSPSNKRVDTLIEAGKASLDYYDSGIAESLLEEAIESAGSVEAKMTLATHAYKIRKKDLAHKLIDEILHADPNHSEARLLYCFLNGNLESEGIQSLRELSNGDDVEICIKAGYEIARVLDLAGDYEGAMEELLKAKAHLMEARTGFVEARFKTRLRLETLSNSFSSIEYDKWTNSLSEIDAPRKMALLGGHPRSGTTLLEQILDSHPDIVSAEETDIFNIFSYQYLSRHDTTKREILETLKSCSISDVETARSRYFSTMDKCLSQPIGPRLLIDKNPSLTPLIPAMVRILPETKFLIMIRDPRDVILSCFMQSFYPLNKITGNFITLEETVAEYVGLMSTWIEVSKNLEGQYLEIRYENLTENLEGEARKVLEFLGVSWNDSVLDFDRHARAKVVRSPTSEAVTEKVHTRARNRWRNYTNYFEPFREQLEPILKCLGYAD